MKKSFVFGMMVLMLLAYMGVSAQNKKTLLKTRVKAMEKEGWYVENGSPLFNAFIRFDSLNNKQPFSVNIGFSYGERGDRRAISKAEEDAVKKYAEAILGIGYEHNEEHLEMAQVESRSIRSIDDSTFKSVIDTLLWNFPMPEFVLLRDRGYGYYDCQSYYVIDSNTQVKMKNMFERIPVKYHGKLTEIYNREHFIKEMEKGLGTSKKKEIEFDEEKYRKEMEKRFEEYKKEMNK